MGLVYKPEEVYDRPLGYSTLGNHNIRLHCRDGEIVEATLETVHKIIDGFPDEELFEEDHKNQMDSTSISKITETEKAEAGNVRLD